MCKYVNTRPCRVVANEYRMVISDYRDGRLWNTYEIFENFNLSNFDIIVDRLLARGFIFFNLHGLRLVTECVNAIWHLIVDQFY